MITSKEIQQGLARHEFSAFYQPKFAVDTAQIAGSEALLRWLRPDGSVVFPAAFIGEAERSSLISEISAYLVDLLMQDMEILQREQFTPVSFNASTHDFKDDTLVRKLLTAIAEHKIEPNQVEVEITEHAALSGQKPVLDNMFRLREAGLGLAMDDYGLAYSSADTLSKWPFSAMKIDQGLIARMLFAEKSASIVRSAIRLGHELELEVVAEGVETAEQYSFLAEAGCTKVQGYLISKPVSLHQVAQHNVSKNCPLSMAVGLVHMAIMDHVQWRKSMVSYALRNAALVPDAPARQEHNYPSLSCNAGALGRWCVTDGQVFTGQPELRDMSKADMAVHAAAAHIVARIQSGACLAEISGPLSDMTRASLVLLECLSTLENRGLAAFYRQRLN